MPKRIAIVEDEAELASLIEYNLARQGYEAQIFPGARGTLKALEQWKPDLMLLDVMLPDVDGFELCRQIRHSAVLGRTPVLFLTARSDEVDRVLGLEIGGDDYMTKPFSPRELMARVKAHLRREELDAEPGGRRDWPVSPGPRRAPRFPGPARDRAHLHRIQPAGVLPHPPRPRLQPRPASGKRVGRAALRHPAHGGRACPAPARAD